MAYKKPEVVAKSEAKQSFVAGCPANKPNPWSGCNYHAICECGKQK